MAEARWCDYQDHAYRGGREGAIMLGQTRKVKPGQQSFTDEDVQEICPECSALLGFNPDYVAPVKPEIRHAAIEKQV